MAALGHAQQDAAGRAVVPTFRDTRTGETERRESVAPRAKGLGLPNPMLLTRRLAVAAMLDRLFGAEKQTVRAAAFGVSATLAGRWLREEPRVVLKNPAPLAMLLALDEESFERTIDALRVERLREREERGR